MVIGKNGAGKSTLFDAFGFVADCLTIGVEAACDREQRGGFERLRSMGVQEPIRFEVYYREAQNQRPITYELAIDLDASGTPVRRRPRYCCSVGETSATAGLFPSFACRAGTGEVWAGEDAVETEGEESNERCLSR